MDRTPGLVWEWPAGAAGTDLTLRGHEGGRKPGMTGTKVHCDGGGGQWARRSYSLTFEATDAWS